MPDPPVAGTVDARLPSATPARHSAGMLWLWVPLGFIAFVVAVTFVVGRRLPSTHTAEARARLPTTPDVAFDLITAVERSPDWRRDVRRVERLPTGPHGAARYVEDGRWGRVTFAIDDLRRPTPAAPGAFVTRIVDGAGGFGGTWTWTIAYEPGQTTVVTLREDGRVDNPWLRFTARYVVGYTRTIDATLRALRAHLDRATAEVAHRPAMR